MQHIHELALAGLAHVLVHVQGIDGPSDAGHGSEAEAAHASDHGQGVITTRQEGNRGDECPTEGGKAESANAHGSPSNPAELLEGGDAGRSSAELRRLTALGVRAAPGLGVTVVAGELRLTALVAQMDVGRIGARRGVVLGLHSSRLLRELPRHVFQLEALVRCGQFRHQVDGRTLTLPARGDLPQIARVGISLLSQRHALGSRQLRVQLIESHGPKHSAALTSWQYRSANFLMACGYRLSLMKTVNEIRLSNFHLLLAEAGNAAALSRFTHVPAPYISQLKNNIPNEGGKPRVIGDDTARKLERGMGKKEGWMDTDHASMMFGSLNAMEAQLVTLFRMAQDEDRDDILRHANNAVSARQKGVPSQANPFAKAPPPGSIKQRPHVSFVPGATPPAGKRKESK